jgi:tetratricopeptide (TPR) repeat protein
MTSFFSSIPKKNKIGLWLTLVCIIILVVLRTPSWQAAAFLNRFSLALAQIGMPNVLDITQESCLPVNDTQTLQQMEIWLDKTASPDSASWLRQGELACLQGDREKAQEAWQLSNNNDTPHPVASLFLATTLFEQGQVIETSFASDIGQYGFLHGLQANRENDDTATSQWYIFSLSYAPSIHTANYLARLYHSQGNIDQVNSLWLELAQPAFSDLPVYWWAKGKLAETEKDWAAAAGYYQQSAQQADSMYAHSSMYAYRAFSQAGIMWYRAEAYEQAKAPLQQALLLELDPKKFDIDPLLPYIWLGKVAFAQMQYEQALAYFTQALLLKPTDSGALYEMAVTLNSLGRQREAINKLVEAIANHQNPPASWKSLLEDWETCPVDNVEPDCNT